MTPELKQERIKLIQMRKALIRKHKFLEDIADLDTDSWPKFREEVQASADALERELDAGWKKQEEAGYPFRIRLLTGEVVTEAEYNARLDKMKPDAQ